MFHGALEFLVSSLSYSLHLQSIIDQLLERTASLLHVSLLCLTCFAFPQLISWDGPLNIITVFALLHYHRPISSPDLLASAAGCPSIIIFIIVQKTLVSMSLTTLPPELFSCIVANIESQLTLGQLAQCSRQLYLCVIPHLYRRVTIHEGRSSSELRDTKLRALGSLLLRRPDLAKLVRYFTLYGLPESFDPSDQPEESREFGEFEEFEHFEEHLSPENINIDQAFKTAVHALYLSKGEEINWLRQLSDVHHCHADLILALLLPALAKVEKLVLYVKIGCHAQYYLGRIIRKSERRERPFNTQPVFEALTGFKHYSYQTSIGPGLIASLVKLPALRLIYGNLRRKWRRRLGENRNFMDLDSTSSPLTSLELTVHSLTKLNLDHVLRAPKALQCFSYMVFSPCRISFTDIRHALEPHENSLRCLSFEHDEVYGLFFSRSIDKCGPMTSFITFNNLKIFRIAALFLWRTDNGTEPHSLINMFPPSLEALHLTQCGKHLIPLQDPIEDLLAHKSPQQIPSLKVLVLHKRKYSERRWTGRPETLVGRLSRLAAVQGVSLEFHGYWEQEVRGTWLRGG